VIHLNVFFAFASGETSPPTSSYTGRPARVPESHAPDAPHANRNCTARTPRRCTFLLSDYVAKEDHMRKVEIRVPDQDVDALRVYARWRAYETGIEFQWTDAARLAIAQFLENEGVRSVDVGAANKTT
jgi:hypothetical protein